MDIYIKQLSSDEIVLLYLKEMINHNVNICKYILKLKKEIENKETMEWYIEKNKPSRSFRYVKLKMWPIKHDIKHVGSKNFIQDIRFNNINKNPKLRYKIKFINNCKIDKYRRTRIYELYKNGYDTYLIIE